jgi:hypothetical protein
MLIDVDDAEMEMQDDTRRLLVRCIAVIGERDVVVLVPVALFSLERVLSFYLLYTQFLERVSTTLPGSSNVNQVLVPTLSTSQM